MPTTTPPPTTAPPTCITCPEKKVISLTIEFDPNTFCAGTLKEVIDFQTCGGVCPQQTNFFSVGDGTTRSISGTSGCGISTVTYYKSNGEFAVSVNIAEPNVIIRFPTFGVSQNLNLMCSGTPFTVGIRPCDDEQIITFMRVNIV